MRFNRKSQFAKFGSISTFKSVNWIKNDAWPIQVTATSPYFGFGRTGRCLFAVARREPGLSRPARGKCARVECLAGVESLNDRGSFRRGTGLGAAGLLIKLLKILSVFRL